ncbi:MAG: cytochrome c [Planctomycetes bacterium]|nr:cytochrome c [Planctomycetota bacterium]
MGNARSIACCSSILFAVFAASLTAWDSAAKPSAYAPANDLIRQLEAMVKRMGEDLSAEADYGEDQQGRIVKDANTVIVIGQVLGVHDQDHRLKGSAAGIISAAGKLAGCTAEFARAQGAWNELKMAMSDRSEEKVEWKPTADIAALMKQVPIINNSLRRGVGGNRFAKSLDQSAAQAATLAAIAELAGLDNTYCEAGDDFDLWRKVSAEMRDAAASVVTAVRKEDQSAASASLDRLVKTCDACHERFRKP